MTGFRPGRVSIDAYGDGVFRFDGMSHPGSLLVLPDGMHGWTPADARALRPEDFAEVFAARAGIDFVLLGTGVAMLRPPKPVREAFAEVKLSLDFMDTGAAVRTFNVLLAEKRNVAAALIAVETAR